LDNYLYPGVVSSPVLADKNELNIQWHNSSQGSLYISVKELNASEDYSMRIFDMTGQLIKYCSASHTKEWNRSYQLPSGTYAMVIVNRGIPILSEKMVVVR